MKRWENNHYTEVVLTKDGVVQDAPRKVKWCHTTRKNWDDGVDTKCLGEIGERCVAYRLETAIKDGMNLPIFDGLDKSLDWTVMTTEMLEQRGCLSNTDAVRIQDAGGIDLIILQRQDVPIFTADLLVQHLNDGRFRTVQVKTQPFAINYRTINIEVKSDRNYSKNKVLDKDDPNLIPSGMFKTFSDWTCYLISANCLAFAPTSVYKELSQPQLENKDYAYQGHIWKGGNARDIGLRLELNTLLLHSNTFTLDLNSVFRAYFRRLSECPSSTDAKNSHWTFSSQDWTADDCLEYLKGGITPFTKKGKKLKGLPWECMRS